MHRSLTPALGIALGLALGLLLTLALAAGPPARAAAAEPARRDAPPVYVALGDSFSSGVGTRDYLDDKSGCLRSTRAFPHRLARAQGWRLRFEACSGATVRQVRRRQLAALVGADYVSVGVGGNDARFKAVLTECALPRWVSDCGMAVDGAGAVVRDVLPGRLTRLMRRIDARAPGAVVVVVGYPRLFMGEDCNVATWFSPAEQRRLNATQRALNAALRTAAGAEGFGFADPTTRFTGHAVCDDTEWINGLSRPLRESYHPNRAGHRDGYAPLVGARLRAGG
ncbi:SGNH/GDSL hydrolase family protein [Nocardioides sp. dk4132]|uniref:SGNH/GDSL hydrolase family protein n=1 Tax=unclassified Nocardioides TaxID=2615069 RepID=UPI001295F684|nr:MULTISPECIES: SGNH/GDSL hydrolase family protein [unclassified Nocardioides]MQW76983.1 SGNH/GDSL hydrolase family protein [Nocardioides sp. dk4132]QGA09399.1 SGNH/GDSL hydrolase family protein [Nocardioides sp. dk884]